MARRKSTESRMTVYRLTGLEKLKNAIRDEYSKFKHEIVKVGSRNALLITGATSKKKVRWGKLVNGLSGKDVNLETSVPGAILLIPDTDQEDTSEENNKKNIWAITFGIGFQMLDQRYIDAGFGKRVAIRCIDPKKLNSITKVTLDDRSKTDRSSIPSGSALNGFGYEELGELATRLVAIGKIENIGKENKNVIIRGADALSIPLSKNPDQIIDNLDNIKELLEKQPVSEELALLEKISLVPTKNSEYIEGLNKELMKAIISDTDQRIALAWPHETVNDMGEVQAFQIRGAQRDYNFRGVQDGLPTLDILLEPIRMEVKDKRQYRLNMLSVMLFENIDGNRKSPNIPVKNWISFEVDVDGKKHFLHGGRWYIVDDDYCDIIQKKTEKIFNRANPLHVTPPWLKSYSNELEYNQNLAEACGGICLDQSLISIESRKSRIEACDVLLKGGTFVHVKRVDSSAPASHLIAQALVSTDILTHDRDAQAALRSKINDAGHNPDEYECVPKKVVIVMVKDNHELTPESLYTFTQVNLNRQDKTLSSRGVEVCIVPIARET